MNLDFHPGLPLEVRVDIKEAGREAGLPLWRMELLGQDETTAVEFANAARRGEVDAFLEEVDWDVLEARYQDRRRKESGAFWQRPNMTPAFPEILPVGLLLPGLSGGRN
jgi:hypothetical protein